MIEEEQIIAVQVILLDWHEKNKRFFSWRYTFNPYYTLIWEVLLQQTDAGKVIEPYQILVKEYPNIQALSEAKFEDIKNIISKIGLFYRAERLIKTSKYIVSEFAGNIPTDVEKLLGIFGIGRYMAHAILCFGYSLPYELLDTNIIRLYSRTFGVKSYVSRARDDKKIWKFAQHMLPEDDYIDFNYALLDFGAIVCKSNNQNCTSCVMNYICLKDF